MIKVTVSGAYRTDEGAEHGTPSTKPYSVSFDMPENSQQIDIIAEATRQVRKLDPLFKSFKTHKIVKDD